MKKLAIVLTLMLSISMASYSQFGVKGGFALGVPTNANNSKAYPGFDIGATYNFTDHFRGEVLFEGMFSSTNSAFFTVSNSLLPVTIGADYSFLEGKAHPYVGLNLGLYTNSVKFGNTRTSESYFGLYPKIGINYEITDNLLLDLTAKYHMYFVGGNNNNTSTPQLFGLNVGINYLF